SLGPGFLCAATGDALDRLATGRAAWRVRRIGGYRFTGMSEAAGSGIGIGPVEDCDAAAAAWDPRDDAAGAAWSEP
ncbi:hypothetical protein, partial [Pseudomonas pergaminensis]